MMFVLIMLNTLCLAMQVKMEVTVGTKSRCATQPCTPDPGIACATSLEKGFDSPVSLDYSVVSFILPDCSRGGHIRSLLSLGLSG